MATLIWIGVVLVMSFPLWGWLVKKLAERYLSERLGAIAAGTIIYWMINLGIVDVVVSFSCVYVLGALRAKEVVFVLWPWEVALFLVLVAGNAIAVAWTVFKDKWNTAGDVVTLSYVTSFCIVAIGVGFWVITNVATAISTSLTAIPPQ